MHYKYWMNIKSAKKFFELLVPLLLRLSKIVRLEDLFLKFLALDVRLLRRVEDPFYYKLGSEFVVDINKKLELAWLECDFVKFLQIYISDSLSANCVNNLRFYYLNSDYLRFSDCLSCGGVRRKESYKLFCHLILGFEPDSFVKIISEIRVKLNDQNFEKIKDYYYCGNVKKAEKFRMSLNSSCHSQLVKITGDKAMLRYEDIISMEVRLLFIPEQGVGDEVRWARLYKYLDYSNVTFACDERLEPIFDKYLKNAKLLSIKSLYTSRGDVQKTLEQVSISLMGKNIFKEYDFIRTGCALFDILPENLLQTNLNSFLSMQHMRYNAGKIKVGIAWSSAVRSPMRSVRYGLPLVEIIEILPDYFDEFEFYAIQSSMTSEEKLLCKASRINIVEDIDFYNDFKSSADFYSTLDAVVGVSTLNTELAAAVGPTFYHIANAPDIFYMRTGSLMNGHYDASNHADQLGSNVKTIGPLIGYKYEKSLVNKSCFSHAMDRILQDLKSD